MKNTLSIFAFAFLLIFACKPGLNEAGGLPVNVADLKSLLNEKQKKLTDLQREIKTIEEELVKQDPSLANKNRTPVRIDTLALETFEHKVKVQGYLQAKDEIFVSSESGGRIISLYVEEGDYVTKGELIAKLDLETIEIQIAELETQLDLANTLYEKQKRLWDQKIGSEVQFLQAENNKKRLERSLEVLKSQLNKGEVYAPIAGYIDVVNLEQGEVASPGSPIVQILNTSHLKVVADIPDHFLGKVKKGQTVDIYFPSIEKSMTGRISLLGRKIDESNRTFSIEIDIRNPSGNLKPNLLAELEFVDYKVENSIFIPIEVIQQEVGGKKYVLLANPRGADIVAEKKYIETGDYTDNKVIINEGLQENDLLITQGMIGVVDKQPIQIIGE